MNPVNQAGQFDPTSLPSSAEDGSLSSQGTEMTSSSTPSVLSIRRDKIKLGRELGKGAFGTVYEGTWDFRKVAVKCYEGARLPERTAREIQHEVSVMQRLDHECLVRLFGLVEEESTPAMLVMEFGANGSLYTYLHSDSEISWMHRLRLAEELARGLAYLHDKGIIHRDIKSLNIVLDRDLHAKWCDFGLAQLKQHSTMTSKVDGSGTQAIVGTLHWMAPEQFSRKTSAPSMRSDVWGLGMVYYEIATREIPFKDAQTEQQVISWIMSGEGEEIPADLNEQAPEFAKVMRSCWAALNERPTAAKIAQEVDRVARRMNGEEVSEEANFSYGMQSAPIDSGVAAFRPKQSQKEEQGNHPPVGQGEGKEPARENRAIQGKLPRFIDYRDNSSGFECLRRINFDRDSGAIQDQETKNTWLHIAAMIEHPVMLMGFLAFDPKVNLEQRNADDMTPLMLALKEQKEQSVEILLNAGADIYALSEKHGSALHLAARTSERVIDIILRHKGSSLNLEIENSDGETPLFAAIRAKQTETAIRLIDQGANIHKFNKGETSNPVSAAAWSSETRVVQYLLQKEADTSNTSFFTGDGKKHTAPPIFGAAYSGADLEMIKALIDAGNDPQIVLKDKTNLVYFLLNGAEPLHLTPDQTKRPEVLEYLLEDLKLNPSVQSTIDGTTPLHLAKEKDIALLKLLLKHGANPNLKNKKGNTPLFEFCFKYSSFSCYSAEKIKLLLNAGADPNIKNQDSKTCFHEFVLCAFLYPADSSRWAIVPHAYELTRLFLQKGGKINSSMSEIMRKSETTQKNQQLKELVEEHTGCIIM